MRSAKLALVAAAFAALLVPALAHANTGQQGSAPVMIPAPQYRISAKYAKSLVSQKATEMHGRYGRGWTVTFQPMRGAPIGGSTVEFHATVNWGKGPHIMTMNGQAGGAEVAPLIAVPDVRGTINMQKAPAAPKGMKRLQVLAPGQEF